MRQSRQIARETNSQAVFNEIAERKLDARLEDTERYFYNDLSFQGIVFGERPYVIGRKGTGKTAIAEFIRSKVSACSTTPLSVLTTAMAITFLLWDATSLAAGQPQPQLRCGLFANSIEAAPQTDPEAVQRFETINRDTQAGLHTVVFLGDSLTQKWDRSVWEQNFARLRPLNAGVNGDRTENLLWRIEHGNLDGQRPNLLVLLIGTNDIGRNRPAAVIAEGIRQILMDLRSRLPEAHILLLGVLPRSESPSSHRRRQVAEVNQLIRTCADHRNVVYANVGDALLDPAGRLSREVSPDGVHLSERGYVLLTNRLQQEFGKLLSVR